MRDNTVIVGTPRDEGGGSVYVYGFDGSQWSEQQKLTSSDRQVGDMFGDAVSIDGDLLLVGAPFDDDGESGSGGAYIFRRGIGMTIGRRIRFSEVAGLRS